MHVQAAKILANLLVAGGTVLFRAATTAYKQAIISAWCICDAVPLVPEHHHNLITACSQGTAWQAPGAA